jgi:hypothetical protein
MTAHLRNPLLWIADGAFVCFFFSGCIFDPQSSTSAAATGGGSDTVPLEEVVKEVKNEVKDYQNRPVPGAPLPRLDTAEFNFKVVRTVTGGLSVNVYLFKIGGSYSREATHSVTYTYKVPPPEKKLAFAAQVKRPPPKEDSLSETIRRAAEAAKAATSFGDLPLNEMAINIQFVVKWAGNIGVEAPISIVTVGANVSGDKSTTQSVKLVFGKAKKKNVNKPQG